MVTYLLSRSAFRVAFLAALSAAVLGSGAAWAFPENVRHGYPNCASCHVNPNGKGLLTDYGRELSVAIQSNGRFFFEPSSARSEGAQTGAQDGAQAQAQDGAESQDGKHERREQDFLYGYFAHPDWLLLGGDIRALQLFSSTPVANTAQFYWMQLDLEGAVKFGKFTVDASVGRDDPTLHGNANPGFGDYWVSRNHYVIYQATDELYVMGGKYWKPYGILDANHSTLVKGGDGRGMGWDYDSQSYNLQAGYQTNSYSLVGYADFGSPTTAYGPIESGGGGTASIFFSNSYKVGLSFFYGTTDTAAALYVPAGHRYIFGPWGILGFTDHFYLNTENNFVRGFPNGGEPYSGVFNYSRLGYEWVQGFHTYIEENFGRANLSDSTTQGQYYGIGLLYYPRTHWEFEANYQKRNYDADGFGFVDYLYFQVHYYL